MAELYISENSSSVKPDLLVCQYGRINRYNDNTWQIAGGSLPESFKKMADKYYSIFPQIQKINLPNGDVLDAPHFWAVLNTMMTGFGDLGGWGGDLVEFAANVKADNTVTFPSGDFNREDWISDADGYNIYTLYPDNILLGLKTYFTSTLTEKQRVVGFKTSETIGDRFQNSSNFDYLSVLMIQKGVTSTEIALAAQKMQEYLDANSTISIVLNSELNTYCCAEEALDFTDNADVEAYTAKMNESKTSINITRVYQVPAGEGILLKKINGTENTFSVNVIFSAPPLENNQLVGTKAPVTVAELVAQNAYILVNGNFSKVAAEATGLFPAGKAYLVPN